MESQLPGQLPPFFPNSALALLWNCRWWNDSFYVGETDDFAKRLAAHR